MGDWMEGLSRRVLWVVVLVLSLGVVSGCDGLGDRSMTPTPKVSVATPEPTATVDLMGAKARFESGGELSFDEVLALKLELVGDGAEINKVMFGEGEYRGLSEEEKNKRWDEYEARERAFVDKLEKCKLKEMVGWIESMQPNEGSNSNEVWLYAFDVYDVANEERNFDYGLILPNMTDEQVGEMKYGQRMKVSGKLGLNSEWGRVELRDPVYSLLEDEAVGEAPTAEELSGLKVTLVRSMCQGFCPDYVLSIGGDGSVSFDGHNYTDVEGKAEGKIEQAQVAELVREIKKVGFFELKDSYEVLTVDVPTYSLRVEMSGKTKDVTTNGPGPSKLFVLMDRVDQIAKSKQWIGDGK